MPTLTRQSLAALRWTVRAVGDLSQVPANVRGRTIPATVPGCIHTDLMDAGLIPDPAVGMNEKEVQWVSWTDWRYECEFDADPALFAHHETDLNCECLDTIATIELNGLEIGKATSEFIPWRFGVQGILKPGRNTLCVTFTSPLRHVHEMAAKLGPRPHNGDEQGWAPFNMIRKCASNFGWDWGPRVATCGIVGSITLHGWSHGRMELPRVDRNEFGDVSFVAELRSVEHCRPPTNLTVESLLQDSTGKVVDQSEGVADEDRGGVWAGASLPYMWHFRDDGPQSIYQWTVILRSWNEELDRWTGRVGACDPSLNMMGERDGAFHLYTNEKQVFCKGANWIPEGLWPRDRTPARCRERLRQALDANMNMIRVWGGGRYEPDWFYDLCDEMGIMVWQDFMFACACYPEEEPLRSLIEREARYQVARLSRHPCVVLWCGGNECHWAYESWGFKERLAASDSPKTWGEHYWREMLPKIVAELSPGTPYWPDSPFSPSLREGAGGWVSFAPDRHGQGDHKKASHKNEWVADEIEVEETIDPSTVASSPATLEPIAKPTHPNPSLREGLPYNSPNAGDRHTWDAWGDGYRGIVPRFCSEFGQQAPANWRTLEEAGLIARTPHAPNQSRDRKGASEAQGTNATANTSETLPHGRVSENLLPPALAARQLGPGGNARWYDDPMREWFKEPRDLDEWHAMAQLLQARSLRIAIEWMRANRPQCMGALVWQLNDAWPGLSWSLIDSAGRPKLAYEAVKQAFAPVLLTIQPIDGRLRLCLVCDELGPTHPVAHIRRLRLDGTVLAEASNIRLVSIVHGVHRDIDIESLVGAPADIHEEFIVADMEGHRAVWFYAPDRLVHHRPPAFDIEHRPVFSDTTLVTLMARSVIRDLWIDEGRLPGGVRAELATPLRTMLPGERTFIRVGIEEHGAGVPTSLDVAAMLRMPVLWSATDFRAHGTHG